MRRATQNEPIPVAVRFTGHVATDVNIGDRPSNLHPPPSPPRCSLSAGKRNRHHKHTPTALPFFVCVFFVSLPNNTTRRRHNKINTVQYVTNLPNPPPSPLERATERRRWVTGKKSFSNRHATKPTLLGKFSTKPGNPTHTHTGRSSLLTAGMFIFLLPLRQVCQTTCNYALMCATRDCPLL